MFNRIWNYVAGSEKSIQEPTFQPHPSWILENQRRAQLEARDDQNNTPLIVAIAQSENDYAAELIAMGANLEARGNYGFTPLAVAAILGNGAGVELLLHHGADKEVITYERGRKPLAWAVHEGHAHVVSILHAAGADCHAIDNDGQTAISLAEHAQDSTILQILTPVTPSELKTITTELAPQVAISPETEEMSDEEDFWLDPVTMTSLEDPVTVPSGYTYSRQTLVEWFKQKGNPETIPCPMTRIAIPLEALTWGRNSLISDAMEKKSTEASPRDLTHSAVRAKRLRFFDANSPKNEPIPIDEKRIKLANNGRL